jgi:hypothetical protein
MFYLPPGLYTIGDPCDYFSYRHDISFEEFLLINNFPGESYLDQNGKLPCVCFETYYGEGLYEDNFSNEYPVDSGMIGIFPHNEFDKVPSDHTEMYFGDTFSCSERKGVLTFGNVIINTKNAETSKDEEESIDYDEY